MMMQVNMNKSNHFNPKPDFVVIISADAEWGEVTKQLSGYDIKRSPFGEWFKITYPCISELEKPVIFIQGGWGKVAAAGSAQYVIDNWQPQLIVNLGTCGGFEGEINRGQIILVEKTVIYDIYEQMGDPVQHIRHYMATIDNSWINDPLPIDVIRTVLVSGDKDLFWKDVASLKTNYGAVAGDWESGAIAWIASKNHTQCFILRGVTDLVGISGGDAYEGKVEYYYENTRAIMKDLVESLPYWLLQYIKYLSRTNQNKK
jgi:adenosylhomocysteine nucleosidase